VFEARWNRLLHYLRQGLTDAGQDGWSLVADERSRSLKIPIPGTGRCWECEVEEADVLHGDLRLEADFLLTAYRIARGKPERTTA
jgi:hypothetical protein